MILFGVQLVHEGIFTQRIMEAYEKLHKGLDFCNTDTAFGMLYVSAGCQSAGGACALPAA